MAVGVADDLDGQRQALVVHAVAAETVPVEIISVASVGVGVVAVGFVGGRVAFKATADGEPSCRLWLCLAVCNRGRFD